MGYLDLHSHVLPALDDGVPALPESLALIDVLQQLGFETVCATPHQRQGYFLPTREAIDGAYTTVRAALSEAGSPIELLLGAENFWDEVLLQRWPSGAQPTYTGGRAFLVEINVAMTPPRMLETMFKMRLGGKLPVLAHPERYAGFWDKNFPGYSELGRTAALVVDLAALDGAHGRPQCTAARRLLEEGLAHAVASDVHSLADARAVGAGMQWIKKRLGEPVLRRMLDENPRQILNGELPD